MNLINETTGTAPQSATTERKPGRARRTTTDKPTTSIPTGVQPMKAQAPVLNGNTSAKFVLFGIPKAQRVANGPVMRGFIEVKDEGEGRP